MILNRTIWSYDPQRAAYTINLADVTQDLVHFFFTDAKKKDLLSLQIRLTGDISEEVYQRVSPWFKAMEEKMEFPYVLTALDLNEDLILPTPRRSSGPTII